MSIVSAECSGVGDIMAVHGAVEMIVSTDACAGAGASMTAIATQEGSVTFELTDPRYGSGDFDVGGTFTDSTRSLTVYMEDGYGDGDYNDNVLLVTISSDSYPKCRLFVDSLLNDAAIRDSFISEHLKTMADPYKTERGGHVYQSTQTGDWRWAVDGPVPPGNANACGMSLVPQPGPDEVVLASWHTHGYRHGDVLYDCLGSTSGTPQSMVNTNRYGGGSWEDWPANSSKTYDAYTIDGDQINRLAHDVMGLSEMQANRARYYWKGIGQCLSYTP